MEKSKAPAKLHFECHVPDNYNPDLPPVIFVHGIGDSCKGWKRVFTTVAEKTKRKVYAIDLRNHGKSEQTDSISNEDSCLDLEHFMVENGIKKTIFVSHSFGARVCMSICLRKPELVEKIVIEDAALKDPSPKEIELLSSILTFVRGFSFISKKMKENEIRSFMVKHFKEMYPENPDIITAINSISLYRDASGILRPEFNTVALDNSTKDRSIFKLDFPHFKTFDGPTLIVYGSRSQLEISKDKLLPKYFPKAKYYEVKNGTHYVHTEFPEEFKTKVCEFINEDNK